MFINRIWDELTILFINCKLNIEARTKFLKKNLVLVTYCRTGKRMLAIRAKGSISETETKLTDD